MDDEADRAAILRRRSRFMAAAVAGLVGAAATQSACDAEVRQPDGGGGSESQGAGGEGGAPQACLGALPGGGGAGTGGSPQPCLEPPIGGAGGEDGFGGRPQPCLEAPLGGGGFG